MTRTVLGQSIWHSLSRPGFLESTASCQGEPEVLKGCFNVRGLWNTHSKTHSLTPSLAHGVYWILSSLSIFFPFMLWGCRVQISIGGASHNAQVKAMDVNTSYLLALLHLPQLGSGQRQLTWLVTWPMLQYYSGFRVDGTTRKMTFRWE